MYKNSNIEGTSFSLSFFLFPSFLNNFTSGRDVYFFFWVSFYSGIRSE